MAFLRYSISASAAHNASNLNTIFNDIIGWVNGSITSTSGFSTSVCNIASSEIEGTIPASVYSAVKNNNTSDTSDNQFYIDKYHSDWSSYNSSHPRDRMYFYWTATGTYKARMRVSNRVNGNLMPYPSSAYYHAPNTSTSYETNLRTLYTTILIWLEADYMAMQAIDSNLSDAIFIGSFDQPRSEYAEWAFSQNSNFANAITISSLMNGTYNNSTVDTFDYFHVSAHDYYDASGSNQAYPAGYQNASSYFTGFSAIDNSSYQSIYPIPWMRMQQVPISGSIGHQLVPVFSASGVGAAANGVYPINGRLKGIYRTSDNFASSGTRVVYNGNTYRVCMMHKTGSSPADAQNTLNACYLLKVTS